ncbi:hypothetical protein GCM10027406_24190 [Leifsonia lichenia]
MVGDAGEPVEIDGSSRPWRVDPAALDALGSGRPFTGRTALLSPFDRLIHDRVRTHEISTSRKNAVDAEIADLAAWLGLDVKHA